MYPSIVLLSNFILRDTDAFAVLSSRHAERAHLAPEPNGVKLQTGLETIRVVK
jgi:hypothetical protein